MFGGSRKSVLNRPNVLRVNRCRVELNHVRNKKCDDACVQRSCAVDKPVNCMMAAGCLYGTNNGGYNATANDKAEMYVGILNNRSQSSACTNTCRCGYGITVLVLGLQTGRIPLEAQSSQYQVVCVRPEFGNRALSRHPRVEGISVSEKTGEDYSCVGTTT